jgi:hypothetical protein
MFTNDELNVLMQLLDIATKAGGLQVAQQALPLAVKIQEMAKNSQPAAEPQTVSAE